MKPVEDKNLRVIENEDGSLTIEWDDDHPFSSIFSSWTEDDWIESIRLGSERARLKE
jgi:hypothetical protein